MYQQFKAGNYKLLSGSKRYNVHATKLAELKDTADDFVRMWEAAICARSFAGLALSTGAKPRSTSTRADRRGRTGAARAGRGGDGAPRGAAQGQR